MRRTLRRRSRERKGGMSFESRVIHPPRRDGAANWGYRHSCNVLASIAAHKSGNNWEDKNLCT